MVMCSMFLRHPGREANVGISFCACSSFLVLDNLLHSKVMLCRLEMHHQSMSTHYTANTLLSL